jgi:pyocin large subunit-like protein
MSGVKQAGLAGALLIAGAGLWACGKGADAPARSHAEDVAPPSRAYDSVGQGGGYADRSSGYEHSSYGGEGGVRGPVPLVDGTPMWSDNRRHTAEENADYHFHRDGPDFGAADVKDYVAKAHNFIAHPPQDVETVNRPNGDKLIYDPKSNTFAVERKDGAPRTMFKPRDGLSYWKEQQARAASGDDGYAGRSYQQSQSE